MQINRRDFLMATAGLALSGCLPTSTKQLKQSWFVSAASDSDGNHFTVAVDFNGKLISKVALPERGHDVLPIPNKPGHAFVIARRPDRYLLEIDFRTGDVVQQTESDADSHFYGHGRLIENGRYLLTSENQFDSGKGMIVVRDAQKLWVLDRFESGGIGPHDMAMLPNGKTLVVANGGIKTHPDYHRIKLNLDEMAPNLSYIDVNSGRVLASYQPEHHQQSIRHLNVRNDGKVFLALQYQGNKQDIVPLIYAHHGEEHLQPFIAPDSQWRSMNQYTASVLAHGEHVAVSCPRGGTFTLWNAESRQFEQSIPMTDVAGLCASDGHLMASTGHGKLYKQALSSTDNIQMHNIRFDNHMAVVRAS